MPQFDHFIHSPFSPFTIGKEENKSLLLQFILSELFAAFKYNRDHLPKLIYSSEAFFYPYDWSLKCGCLNRMQEHAILLKMAFRSLSNDVAWFAQILEKAIDSISNDQQSILTELKELFRSLFPFIKSCRKDENLLFFLTKNYKEIFELKTDNLNFFLELYPEGMQRLQKVILENYQKREMHPVLAEARSLFDKLNKKNAIS